MPVEATLEKVRSGENPELTTREKHERICYVVAEEGQIYAIEKKLRLCQTILVIYNCTFYK